MAVYPRKQTLLVFAVCLIAVLAVAYYVHGDFWTQKTASTNQVPQSKEVAAAAAPVLPTDTDWKREFLTNSTNDSAFTAKKTPGKSTQQEKLSATEVFSRDFFTKYMNLRSTGLNDDKQSINGVMQQVSQEAFSGIATPKTYTIKNIKVASAASEAVLHTYGQTVAYIFAHYIPIQSEAALAQQAFADNNMSELKNIDPIIAGYKQAIAQLTATPVPASLVQYHLDLINGFSNALYNAQALRTMDTDPLTALAAISLEKSTFSQIDDSLTNIEKYFSLRGMKIDA